MIGGDAKQSEIVNLEGILAASRGPLPADGDTIFVFFPESLSPFERYQKYQDPLDKLMRDNLLGGVDGGGSWFDQTNLVASGVASCDVSVKVAGLKKSLSMLREWLPRLQCLAGTQLQYQVGPHHMFDEYDGVRWIRRLRETCFKSGRSFAN